MEQGGKAQNHSYDYNTSKLKAVFNKNVSRDLEVLVIRSSLSYSVLTQSY